MGVSRGFCRSPRTLPASPPALTGERVSPSQRLRGFGLSLLRSVPSRAAPARPLGAGDLRAPPRTRARPEHGQQDDEQESGQERPNRKGKPSTRRQGVRIRTKAAKEGTTTASRNGTRGGDADYPKNPAKHAAPLSSASSSPPEAARAQRHRCSGIRSRRGAGVSLRHRRARGTV